MLNLKYVFLAVLVLVLISQTFYIITRSFYVSTTNDAGYELSGHEYQKLSIMNQTLTELNAELRAISNLKKLHVRRGGIAESLAEKELAQSTVTSGRNSGGGALLQQLVATTPPPPLSSPVSSSVSSTVSSTDSSAQNINKNSKKRSALLFTMDSISSYEQSSKQGGAAGELIIRHALEDAFKELGVQMTVCRSDGEFERSNAKSYDIIILDPWTWAAKGWVPKAVIRGLDSRIFILDFFGSKGLRGQGMSIPLKRYLTAFGSPWNSFLGYYMTEDTVNPLVIKKKPQGVIWGKDTRHFTERVEMLKHVADKFTLVSTATSPVFRHENVKWLGHQSPKSWRDILKESKFLIGLGDPLLGPSAIDAISVGCMFINPIYEKPVREAYTSQHPYAVEKIGEPYVCSYKMKDAASLMSCVEKAMKTDLKPFIPSDFTKSVYVERVAKLFEIK